MVRCWESRGHFESLVKLQEVITKCIISIPLNNLLSESRRNGRAFEVVFRGVSTGRLLVGWCLFVGGFVDVNP